MDEEKKEKRVMNTVVFMRKAKDSAELQRGTWPEHAGVAVSVERVVELPPERFQMFADNLLADSEVLREHQHEMYVEEGDQVWHCLLVKAQGARDGILVMADGYEYARYSAYCPDCQPFVRELAERVERTQQEGGGSAPLPPQERTPKQDRRFFLVSYDYTESGVTEHCGFLCEATTIRQAAELFWSQHPGEWFQLQRVTDGRIEAFWDASSGQFVTIPGREEEEENDQAPALAREGASYTLQHGLSVVSSLLLLRSQQHRQQDSEHVLGAGQAARRKGDELHKRKPQGR